MYKKLENVVEYVKEHYKEVENIEIVFAKESFGCIPGSDFSFVVFHNGSIFHSKKPEIQNSKEITIFIDSPDHEQIIKSSFSTIKGVNPRRFAEGRTERSASFLFSQLLCETNFVNGNVVFPYTMIPRIEEEDDNYYYISLMKPVK